ELVQLAVNLEKAEDKLQQFSRDKQILFVQDGKNTETSRLQDLETEFTNAQGDRITKESVYKVAQESDIDANPRFLLSAQAAGLVTKLADLKRQDAELSVSFGPEWASRQRVLNQIKETALALDQEK